MFAEPKLIENRDGSGPVFNSVPGYFAGIAADTSTWVAFFEGGTDEDTQLLGLSAQLKLRSDLRKMNSGAGLLGGT
jgi:hypothetical protein